ncbi:helix-turn-helix domain-containing protein [Chryseobacterium defluvii]|uniref:DNA-binding XRE family transcriptional regulator n=1 Tax=Chryseobacterium defluvii TaxID=160396 RepID=A0A495SLW3_9FLAO|nr:helix-turn-helix transcriptional regulator [Chryseobacterium defluvii]RKT01076.1 DNA-binding XRE family transcriptional regulator [Chryseobacterium defluvii]
MKFKIEQLMKEKGFSNVNLAEEFGVSRSTISNNLKKPSLETLIKIADVLGVKVSDLLDEGEDNLEPIYKKDENGKLINIGFLKK